MSYKGKIISELSDVARRWLSSVLSKNPMAKKLGLEQEDVIENLEAALDTYGILTPEFLSKLKNVDTHNPEAFSLIDANHLLDGLVSSSEGFSDLGLIHPKMMEKLAQRIDMTDPYIRTMVNDEVLRKVDQIENNIPRTSGMPYLSYVRAGDGSIQIVGHDGRHVNRALDHLGRARSLIRFIPDNVVGLDGVIRREKLLTELNPDTSLRQQQGVSDSVFTHPTERGALKDIIKKFLAVPAAVGVSGALSEIPNGVE